MDKNKLGLLVVKIFTLLYGIFIVYRLVTGESHYWTDLVLPVASVLALWKLRYEGWVFLQTAFCVEFLYYSFFTFKGIIWISLRWITQDYSVLLLGCLAVAFFSLSVIVNRIKHLFIKGEVPCFWKQIIAILLAFSIPFLPWVERTAWTSLDPRVLDNTANVKQIRFSPDGKKLGVENWGSSYTIHIWDIETKRVVPLHASRNARITSIALNNSFVVIGQAATTNEIKLNPAVDTLHIDLWDVSTGQRKDWQRIESAEAQLISDRSVQRVEFSPDGTYLACATGNSEINMWNIQSGQLVKTLETGITYGIRPMAYSPDGKYLATEVSGTSIGLWDVMTGTLIHIFSKGYMDDIKEIVYSPDGKYIAVAINKRWLGSKAGTEKGFIDIWDVAMGQLFRTLQWDSDTRVKDLSYSPDGKYIATVLQVNDSVQIFDIASGKEIQLLRGPVIEKPVEAVAYSPDGKYLAVASERYIKLIRIGK